MKQSPSVQDNRNVQKHQSGFKSYLIFNILKYLKKGL